MLHLGLLYLWFVFGAVICCLKFSFDLCCVWSFRRANFGVSPDCGALVCVGVGVRVRLCVRVACTCVRRVTCVLVRAAARGRRREKAGVESAAHANLQRCVPQQLDAVGRRCRGCVFRRVYRRLDRQHVLEHNEPRVSKRSAQFLSVVDKRRVVFFFVFVIYAV